MRANADVDCLEPERLTPTFDRVPLHHHRGERWHGETLPDGQERVRGHQHRPGGGAGQEQHAARVQHDGELHGAGHAQTVGDAAHATALHQYEQHTDAHEGTAATDASVSPNRRPANNENVASNPLNAGGHQEPDDRQPHEDRGRARRAAAW